MPHGGFAQLPGGGGPQKFTIAHVTYVPGSLPTASTCVNLFKLPEYLTYQELHERIMVAIQCGAYGYGTV